MKTVKSFLNETSLPIKILLVLSLVFYFAFGSYRLEKFATTDEHYWINERIIQYWQGIKNLDFKKTNINDKPGISLAFVSGLGLFVEPHPDLYIKKLEKHISLHNPDDNLRLNLVFRTPLLVFNGLFLLFIFYLLKKVTDNEWLSFFAVVLMMLSPILLGMSRIVNPDSLLWNISIAAILSFFLYLKNGDKKTAILTSILLAFILATKYTSIILFPFLFAAMFFFFIIKHDNEGFSEKILLELRNKPVSYLKISAGAFAIFSFLMPSILIGQNYFNDESVAGIYSKLWIFFAFASITALALKFGLRFLSSELLKKAFRFLSLFAGLIEKVLYAILIATFSFVLINWLTGQNLINFENIPFDIKRDEPFASLPFYQKFILQFYPLAFSLSPLVLVFLLYNLIESFSTRTKLRFLTFSLSFFMVIFFVSVISTGLLSTIRYSIMVYPILILISSIGIWNFYERFKGKGLKIYHLVIIIFFVSIYALWQNKPFYFNYTNSLLPQKYMITGSWGEGGYEAAQYLNSLPGAENMTIWADYSGVCEFFKGTCIKVYQMEKTKFDIDYYVLTRRGGINYQPDRPRWRKEGFGFVKAYKYYEKSDPIWSLNINDRPGNFIKIFKSED